MTRGERITVASGVTVACGFAAVLASGVADRLNRVEWFSSGANLIQWVSGVGLAGAITTALAMHLTRTCAASWWCFRRGEHPVEGTLKKVCTRHHTLAHHEAVHDAHAVAHARGPHLDLGQSHGRPPVPPPASRHLGHHRSETRGR